MLHESRNALRLVFKTRTTLLLMEAFYWWAEINRNKPSGKQIAMFCIFFKTVPKQLSYYHYMDKTVIYLCNINAITY